MKDHLGVDEVSLDQDSRKRPKSRRMMNPLKMSFTTVLSLTYIHLLCSLVTSTSATITVISQTSNDSIIQFEDEPARFVSDRVTYYEIQGFAVYADPPNACKPVAPPNSSLLYNISVNWILIAKRFDCDFQTKIENAQNGGYSAIIIHNVDSNNTAPMQVSDPSKLVIYASFVGEYYGMLLKNNYSYPNPYFVRIVDDFSLNGYLLPFAIVVGICFIIMLIFMLWQQVTRYLRERRRSRRRKLPNSALKKLPVTKWTKGDPYETCAVCLEDFVETDKVRVLPCSHGFHCVCIDPWLTKGRRVCPICKRKVVLAEENLRDSDNSDTDDESAPLLRNASTSATAGGGGGIIASGSTFVQQEENPFRRAQRRVRLQGHRRLQRTSATGGTADPIAGDVTAPDTHSTNGSSSDSTSIGSSTSSDGNSNISTRAVGNGSINSGASSSTNHNNKRRRHHHHRNLPVLAQVHSSGSVSGSEILNQSSYGTADGGLVPPGSRAPFPSLANTNTNISSKSSLIMSNNNPEAHQLEQNNDDDEDSAIGGNTIYSEGARQGIELSESEEAEEQGTGNPTVLVVSENNISSNKSNNAIV